MKYICKPGHSVALAKGVVGPPVDLENPTKDEIITENNFRNGKKGLTALLQHPNCPIIPFEKIEKKQVPVADKDSQQSEEKKDKSKGAEKK